MNDIERTLRLSSSEMRYLKNAAFLGRELTSIVDSAEMLRGGSYEVRLSRDLAEHFRDAFTEQLARVGFDDDYVPTSEGRLLEELIDRFFEA